MPITNILRILNKDKVILNKPCIQRRVIKALNAMIQIDQFEDLTLDQQEILKQQISKSIREVQYDSLEPLETLSIDRLVSILHGLTGNLPTIELVQTDNDTDQQRQSTVDNTLSVDLTQANQMDTVSHR